MADALVCRLRQYIPRPTALKALTMIENTQLVGEICRFVQVVRDEHDRYRDFRTQFLQFGEPDCDTE